jgi:hypothetical protein
MRVLFIGGTGNISAACSRLCLERGMEVVPDYVARIPFHAGARKTLAWFEADPARQRIVDETNQTMDRYIAAWRQARGAGR